MTNTKLLQKNELSKDFIKSTLKKAINELFETTTINKDCDLNFIVQKVRNNTVYVKFSWIKCYENYDYSCNSWDEVYDNFYSIYNFSKKKDILLDEILEELQENIIVNY